jgi:predicted O-linked N-acetylglucosamine transferase (SPINDLY family)
VVPEAHKKYFTEKVVYLPHTYQSNDSKRPISPIVPSRTEAGLPETGFVFCSFNANWKITPDVFDIWMRLLGQVEGSVLWLMEYAEATSNNLRAEAERRGVSPDRLIFARPADNEVHLARHGLAGLCLDTSPYGGHTTASDALYAGVPMVTCLGQAFSARVAASVLHAVGLPELVTDTFGEYEALALELAREEGALAVVKTRLAENIKTHPLYDTGLYCRHLEAAYETMWARYQRGEPPKSFAVLAD